MANPLSYLSMEVEPMDWLFKPSSSSSLRITADPALMIGQGTEDPNPDLATQQVRKMPIVLWPY
jgi:hypothetical protein